MSLWWAEFCCLSYHKLLRRISDKPWSCCRHGKLKDQSHDWLSAAANLKPKIHCRKAAGHAASPVIWTSLALFPPCQQRVAGAQQQPACRLAWLAVAQALG